MLVKPRWNARRPLRRESLFADENMYNISVAVLMSTKIGESGNQKSDTVRRSVKIEKAQEDACCTNANTPANKPYLHLQVVVTGSSILLEFYTGRKIKGSLRAWKRDKIYQLILQVIVWIRLITTNTNQLHSQLNVTERRKDPWTGFMLQRLIL